LFFELDVIKTREIGAFDERTRYWGERDDESGAEIVLQSVDKVYDIGQGRILFNVKVEAIDVVSAPRLNNKNHSST
jgi:hypothetical protein